MRSRSASARSRKPSGRASALNAKSGSDTTLRSRSRSSRRWSTMPSVASQRKSVISMPESADQTSQ
jgi:hypothetical protein